MSSAEVLAVQQELESHPAEITSPSVVHPRLPRWRLFLITAVLSGVQCSWALQLAFLTPFVQILGIPHNFASLMWLCGPISGLFVQPIVGVVRPSPPPSLISSSSPPGDLTHTIRVLLDDGRRHGNGAD